MINFWLRNRVESGELGKQDEYNDSLFQGATMSRRNI